MDCQSVSDRLAGWVDEQLSPGERELLEEHLASCPDCRARAMDFQAQPLHPPTPRAPDTLRPDFWAQMDSTIALELDRFENGVEEPAPRTAPPPEPLLKRRFEISAPMIIAIAAVMLLSIGFGVRGELKSAQAERAIQQTLVQQERLQRLHGSPPAQPIEQDYSVARRVADEPPPIRGAL